MAKSPEEAAELAENIGSLVVLKVDSSQIVHKSDAGGVKVGVEPADVAWEYKSMMDTLKKTQSEAEINGIRVQEMVEGEEVIVGLKRDPQFGPLIMFGLGGIYVEVLKDVSFRVAPVSAKQAREMIESINGFPILKGVRGKKGVDIDALIDIIQRISQFATDHPEIEELDMNPIIASNKGAGVADVRFRFTE
ncbi:MAG: acetate--CoA ligase family protein [Candidatus Bipolaricaulia bacterium]